MSKTTNIKDIFFDFSFFFYQLNFGFKKVTKTDGNMYAAVSTPVMPLGLLIKNPAYQDAEIYFKTADDKLFRIFQYKLQSVYTWQIHCPTDAGFGTHFFEIKKMSGVSIVVGKVFIGNDDIVIPAEVTEIVVVTTKILTWADATNAQNKIEESKLVKEFYSK